ncbi:hypothetical protein LSCM1_06718 [Leishmania martiniquensis]|uniref:Uncharacterized protein n=1 Tax=Leishmania martiniquensis TaxID=1580590 RepID=A0A836KPU2_9TRYP|nr:hypothetical protein LSCM1_06718 [Leishmania martiniquensis]
MPPKRKCARSAPEFKAAKSRTASTAVAGGADRPKPTTSKKSKTSRAIVAAASAVATGEASRKRGRPRSTVVWTAKVVGAPTSRPPSASRVPENARKQRGKAGVGEAAVGTTAAGQSSARPSHPSLKAARTESVKTGATATRRAAASAVEAPTTQTGRWLVDGHSDTGAAVEGEPERVSLLRRFLSLPTLTNTDDVADCDAQKWNTSNAVVFSAYLAEVQSHLTRHLCRQLARLTTSTTPAFLHAAALGEAALSAFPSPPAAAHEHSGSGDQCSRPTVEQLVDRQEQAYRSLRATIAASCALGHRSCQVLWGPRGSGKHRILRLLADDVRRTPNTFVMELHGRLLRDDEAALGVIAQQMLLFLRSPQSATLRAGHYLVRTGTFEFGQLFHFERHMLDDSVAAAAAAAPGLTARTTDGANVSLTHVSRGVAEGGGRSGVGRRPRSSAAVSSTKTPSRGARRMQWRLSHRVSGAQEGSDADESGEDAEVDGREEEPDEPGSGVMVTSTTTYLSGGAASALPHLQRALLLLKSQGCSMVICIRDIDVFGIRCDQLLYVLSGLMHDFDGGGGAGGSGGMSLVLASGAPDIRQLEKRLSSRLTCETRYVPLLPWSMSGLLAATLHTTAQDASYQVRMKEVGRRRAELVAALRAGATKLRHGTEGGRRATAREQELLKRSMAELEEELHASDATMRELRNQQRHLFSILHTEAAAAPSLCGANSASPSALGYYCASGWRSSASLQLPPQKSPCASAAALSFTTGRTWSVSSLLAHASLTLEVQCVMCEELLRQLCGAIRASPRRDLGGINAVYVAGHSSLAEVVRELDVELELNSCTSSTVLTVLASHLCKTASGGVDLLGGNGRRVLLSWLCARLRHEPIPAPATSAASIVQASAVCREGVPPTILSKWREEAQSMVSRISDSRGLAGEAKEEALFVKGGLRPPLAFGASEPAAANGANGSRTQYLRPDPRLPPLSLLPPHLHDLLADGQLVGMGYGSREVVLVLFYMHIHHTSGVQQRTVADLLEDVSSSLGTKAAASLDREAFRHAIRLLCRWRILRVVETHSQMLEICGSGGRLREFLEVVLSKKSEWCDAELGLDAREIMRLRSLL